MHDLPPAQIVERVYRLERGTLEAIVIDRLRKINLITIMVKRHIFSSLYSPVSTGSAEAYRDRALAAGQEDLNLYTTGVSGLLHRWHHSQANVRSDLASPRIGSPGNRPQKDFGELYHALASRDPEVVISADRHARSFYIPLSFCMDDVKATVPDIICKDMAKEFGTEGRLATGLYVDFRSSRNGILHLIEIDEWMHKWYQRWK